MPWDNNKAGGTFNSHSLKRSIPTLHDDAVTAHAGNFGEERDNWERETKVEGPKFKMRTIVDGEVVEADALTRRRLVIYQQCVQVTFKKEEGQRKNKPERLRFDIT
jgi:hypothetical protein